MAKRKKVWKPNAEYELPKKFPATTKRILALDPGSRNMGISCVGVNKKGDFVVLANAIMMHPITNLVENVNKSINIYLREVDMWVKLFKPDGFIMERFQSRGGLSGPLIELVSGMTLSLCTEYRAKPCKLITAATWKNNFHRKFNDVKLDDLYKQCRTTSHQLDSVLIGCFGLEYGLRNSVNYDYADIIEQAEKTALLKLRNIRGAKK